MKLNILSRSLKKGKTSGPFKVVQNTLLGLENLGCEILVNDDITKHEFNWVHDDLLSYVYAALIQKPILFGPNLVISHIDLPQDKGPAAGSICLVPSNWVKAGWIGSMKGDEYSVITWAAGIDVDRFKPISSKLAEEYIIVYFKNRKRSDLLSVISSLNKRGYKYKIFEYGKYIESEYLASLQLAKYGIWISGTESQGIALMEALATDLPILVWDCKIMSDNFLDNFPVIAPKFPKSFEQIIATSAPYFSDQCGIKIDTLDELDFAISEMDRKYNLFRPRDFILSDYTTNNSARKLQDILKQLPVKVENISAGNQVSKVIKIRYLYEIVFNKFILLHLIKRIVQKLGIWRLLFTKT